MSEVDRKGKPLVSTEERMKLATEALKCIFGPLNAKVKFMSYGGHGILEALPFIQVENPEWTEDLLVVLNRLRESFWVTVRSDRCECEDCKKSKYGPIDMLVVELMPNGVFEKELS